MPNVGNGLGGNAVGLMKQRPLLLWRYRGAYADHADLGGTWTLGGAGKCASTKIRWVTDSEAGGAFDFPVVLPNQKGGRPVPQAQPEIDAGRFVEMLDDLTPVCRAVD